MNTPIQQTRMLLSLWGSCPERVKELRRERNWTQKAWSGLDPMLVENSRALQERIDDEIKGALRASAVVDEAMAGLPLLERQVLHLRYREQASYVSMGMALGYSEDYLRHVKPKAEARLAGLLGLTADEKSGK